MKLGISNIAWNKDIDQNVYKMLYELGIKHLEIAPSRMNSEFNFYKPYSYENEISNINNFNLICESSQAILFGKDELSIFNQDCWDDFFLHLNSVMEFANKFGINKIVFGSPKSRIYNSKISIPENILLAQFFFSKLSKLAHLFNIDILLEPNPKEYKCDFLNTHKEVLDFIRILNLSNIKAHFDTGAAILEGTTGKNFLLNEDFSKTHIHLSCPYLNYNFEDYDLFFNDIIKKLKNDRYNGLCIIEIVTKENTLEIIKNSIQYFDKIINNIGDV